MPWRPASGPVGVNAKRALDYKRRRWYLSIGRLDHSLSIHFQLFIHDFLFILRRFWELARCSLLSDYTFFNTASRFVSLFPI